MDRIGAKHVIFKAQIEELEIEIDFLKELHQPSTSPSAIPTPTEQSMSPSESMLSGSSSNVPSNEPNVCHTGTDAEVTAACDGKCCIGLLACADWGGENTICEQACMGSEACRFLSYGTEIRRGACVGGTSCYAIGLAFISDNSCVGINACDRMGRRYASQVTVDLGSCSGDFACASWGVPVGQSIVVIGDYSCIGGISCLGLPGYSQVIIENEACVTAEACDLCDPAVGDVLTVPTGADFCIDLLVSNN
jgi:hypothetical protein